MASIYVHVHNASRNDMFVSACVLRPLLPVYAVLKASCLCIVVTRFVEALCLMWCDRNIFPGVRQDRIARNLLATNNVLRLSEFSVYCGM